MNAVVALAHRPERRARSVNLAQLSLVWSTDHVEVVPVERAAPRKARPTAPTVPASGPRLNRQRERPAELDLQFVELVNAWIGAEADRFRAQLALRRPMSIAARQIAVLNVDRQSAKVRRARQALESAIKIEGEERA